MPEPAPKVSATAEARNVQNVNELDETRWERIAATFRTVAGAVLLAFVLRTCFLEAFEIEGPSMEPTLLNGDRVVVSKFAYGLFLPLRDHAEISWGQPKIGDVVILKSPADGVDIIKRVIGVSGDQIELREDQVYRNGKAVDTKQVGKCSLGTGAVQPGCRVYESQIDDRSFRFSTAFRSFDAFSARVPDGHIYVLGDHRDHSNDSRNPAIGMVPISAVKGRALVIYWSSGEQGTRFHRAFHRVQ